MKQQEQMNKKIYYQYLKEGEINLFIKNNLK